MHKTATPTRSAHPTRPTAPAASADSAAERRSILITAGPTHEPIDAVRYIGNRSSGRVGVALADAAAEAGFDVTLLLGPACVTPAHAGVRTERFASTADLEAALAREFPRHEVLVMAAAVSDYRPIDTPVGPDGKMTRGESPLTISLTPTPDLLAGCTDRKVDGKGGRNRLTIGFALEPADRLKESALSKLDRKRLDAIVANPLETMDAETISARIFARDALAASLAGHDTVPAGTAKPAFAAWLIGRVRALLTATRESAPPEPASGR